MKKTSAKLYRTASAEFNTTSDMSEAIFKKAVKHVIKTVLANISVVPDDKILENATNFLWNISSEITEVTIMCLALSDVTLIYILYIVHTGVLIVPFCRCLISTLQKKMTS